MLQDTAAAETAAAAESNAPAAPASDTAINAALDTVARAIANAPAPAATDAPAPDSADKMPPLEYVTIPLTFIKAALLCASADEKREYLQGVRLQSSGRDVRVSGTDGAKLFTGMFSIAAPEAVPTWLGHGVTLPRAGLKARLAIFDDMLDKDQRASASVQVGFCDGAPAVVLRDTCESATFRMVPIEGTYPDYAPILAGLENVMGNREFEAGETASFAPKIMRAATEVASALYSDGISLFAGQGGGDIAPAVATFNDAPGAALVLMPLRTEAYIPAETFRALAPATKGTRAAILANLTRTEAKLGDLTGDARAAAEAKCEGYRARIQAIDLGTADMLPLAEPPAPAQIAAPDAPAPDAPAAAAAPTAKAKGKAKGKATAAA